MGIHDEAKIQSFQIFKHWTILMNNQTSKKVKCLRTNNDSELCSTEFNEFCIDKGITRHHIIRYTPQQNEVSERMNMTLLEMGICMLSNSGLNRSFWAEAVNTTCYLVNHSSSTAIDFKTPIEVWSNKPPEYSILKVFGCLTYYHISEGKLEPEAKKGLFMGYGDGVKEF